MSHFFGIINFGVGCCPPSPGPLAKYKSQTAKPGPASAYRFATDFLGTFFASLASANFATTILLKHFAFLQTKNEYNKIIYINKH